MRETGWPTPNFIREGSEARESIELPHTLCRRRGPPHRRHTVTHALCRSLLERRIVRGHQQGRVHLLQLGRTLGEIGLPRRILHRVRARLETLLEVLVAPQMDPLVRLWNLTGPGAPDRRVFLAGGLHFLEVLAVLDGSAQATTIDAQLVDVALGAVVRLDIDDGVHEAQILTHHAAADDRDVLLGPVLVLLQLGAKPRALLVAVVLPEMPDLVERAELGCPVAVVDAVVVATRRAADRLGSLEIFRHLAGRQRVRAKLVDHVVSPLKDAGASAGVP